MSDSRGNLYELLSNDPTRIYVIAEAGFNHGGSRERALTLLRAAKWAGADAVKFPVTCADRLTSTRSKVERAKQQTDPQETAKKLELSHDSLRALAKEAARLDIDFLSTPFDEASAGLLDELGVKAFKIASNNISNRPLIEAASRTGKPVLLSTRTSAPKAIEKAIDWMHTQSNDQTILLHGASTNSASKADLNLRSVEYLRDTFGVPVGFADRSLGTLSATVAVSLGAQVIERNFILETRGEVEAACSMDAKQLKVHIEELRTIATILGIRSKSAAEADVRTAISLPYVRESVVARDEMQKPLFRLPEPSFEFPQPVAVHERVRAAKAKALAAHP